MTQNIRELKDLLYPIILGYYENGETYQNAEKYTEKIWEKVKDCIFFHHNTTLKEIEEDIEKLGVAFIVTSGNDYEIKSNEPLNKKKQVISLIHQKLIK